MTRLVAPLLAAALLLAACRAPETPAELYRRFAEAARKGRAGEVWATLSTGSRKALAERAKALAGAKPPPGMDVSAGDLVLGDLAPTAPKVKSVTVLRESKDSAVVSVEEVGGARGEVSLVREGGEWRVVLPEG
jgi:hypothetical protein